MQEQGFPQGGNQPFGQNGFQPPPPPPGQFPGNEQVDDSNKPKSSGLSTTVKLVITGSALATISIIFAGIYIYKRKQEDEESEFNGGEFNSEYNNTGNGSIYPLTAPDNQQMSYPQVNYPLGYVPGSSQPSNFQGGNSQPSNFQGGNSQPSNLQGGSSQPSNFQGCSSQPSNFHIGSSQQSYPE